jgi:hypothetical protein
MQTVDINSTDENGDKIVTLGDVRSLLLDLAMAQHDDGDDAPVRMMGEQRIRVARVSRIAQICLEDGGTEGQVLLDLVGAVQALEQAKSDFGVALAGLEEWYAGF